MSTLPGVVVEHGASSSPGPSGSPGPSPGSGLNRLRRGARPFETGSGRSATHEDPCVPLRGRCGCGDAACTVATTAPAGRGWARLGCVRAGSYVEVPARAVSKVARRSRRNVDNPLDLSHGCEQHPRSGPGDTKSICTPPHVVPLHASQGRRMASGPLTGAILRAGGRFPFRRKVRRGK
jgi:hypothetical protein